MPKRGFRSTFKVTFRRFKTKKTCSLANQVPEEEAKASAGGRLRRVVKRFRLAVRRKVRRALNRMASMRESLPSQHRRHVTPFMARPRHKSDRTDQRGRRSEPAAEPSIVLRCARTPKASDRKSISLLDLPQDVRDRIFDRVINKLHFKVPATANSTTLSFATDPSMFLVSYTKAIPPVCHQFFDDFIAAVCRHPSCCMIIALQDMSKALEFRRKLQAHPLIPPITSTEFYPGDGVTADNPDMASLRAPKAYNQHIQDLRLHCIIDRSNLGPDIARSNQPGILDTTPSIQRILAIRDDRPNLDKGEINIYFNIPDIRGANYSMLWIDDCLKPLAILPPESTAIQAVIPVTDSQDPKDPTRQMMKPWRVCPGGSEEVDWLHHGHARGVKDITGVWNCYRCLRDHQLLHRYKRMERNWLPHREGNAHYSTYASRWRDEASGTSVANVLQQVVDPAFPSSPPSGLSPLVDLLGRYGGGPGPGGNVYPPQSQSQPGNRFTFPASRHRRYSS